MLSFCEAIGKFKADPARLWVLLLIKYHEQGRWRKEPRDHFIEQDKMRHSCSGSNHDYQFLDNATSTFPANRGRVVRFRL
jgi:hypothetical protein